MNYSEKHIINLISGKIQITAEIASRLEDVLSLSAEFWLGLEETYRLSINKNRLDNSSL